MISPHARGTALILLASLGLASCGGDDTAPAAPVASAPTPTPTPTPTPSTAETEVVLLSDVKYGEGATETGSVDLLLDIYQPDADCSAPRPTVFYVHGGAWIVGDKQDDIVEALAPRVVAEGLNFVSINYRLAGDAPVFSEEYAEFAQSLVDDGVADPQSNIFDAVISSIEDGVTALRWMDENAEEFCLDMDRIGYWGSSAGTGITAQIAYALNPFDIARPEPRFVNAWWGELFRDEDLEVGEVPFLILHGDQDTLVAYEESVALTAQAEVVGLPFAFYTLVGAGHGFDVSNQEQTQAGLQVSVDFAVAQLTGGTPEYGRFDIP
ncbi:MAG: alpha/beta hydrolase [Pseudomonadota bacterium]